ncbi:MAG: hypothetical protein EOM37_00330 [Proteobacteria bacterium]|jgi:hypothetical protein|nr:hypothetical protein [Alphaproteobacteria bacterium]NCC02486.1 hypothetical protein [Pseudomonadota bacterium]
MMPETDHNISLIVAGIILAGFVLMIAPGVLLRNRGVILRNIAIWLGVFLLLAVAYRTIGPGKAILEPTVAQQQPSGSAPTPLSPSSREDEGILTVK